ncbi:MAG: phosphatidate cytidylyltransferase [Deltaproteobacteria bacterium]|nr:phosphatidate cytidylyltransferase [Deltaproteobacteria bacterium]
MHLKRWLTAIVALPILIYLIGFSPRWVLYLFVFLFSLTGFNEFYRLTAPTLPLFLKTVTGLLVLTLFGVMYSGNVLVLMGIISLIIIVPMLYFLFLAPLNSEKYLSEIGMIAVGFIYVCLPLTMLVHIVDRFYFPQHPVRGIWIFFLMVVTFANDTGAFYSGRFFGKHKLYELVSPKKTWEGSIGGLISAFIVAIIFLKIFRIHPVDLPVILLILLLSIAGQVGDLAESMLKRNYNVKDSGELLPGHGGVLDRIDSLLFAVPVLYIYLNLTI